MEYLQPPPPNRPLITKNLPIIVTCGPASEPIDGVRCISNFSTGELGSLLSDCLAKEGWEIFCLRGRGATYPPPVHAQIFPFSTNSDLEELFQKLARFSSTITAVFHAAALCDFQLARIEDDQGIKISSSKLRSHASQIRLILTPAPKLINKLRTWFPQSKIVGWKYELEGSSVQALNCGSQQIKNNFLDACVVNGRAMGNQFAFLENTTPQPTILANKIELCHYLTQWLSF